MLRIDKVRIEENTKKTTNLFLIFIIYEILAKNLILNILSPFYDSFINSKSI